MIFKLAAIFYFSGTGNTWWVAREIAKELMQDTYGFDCPIYSIESKTLMNVKNLVRLLRDKGTIGIGYPIYSSDIPPIMREFLELFPSMDNFPTSEKKMFIFNTQLIFSGDGAIVPKKILEKKGYKVRWTTHFNMPNNITIPMSPFPYTRTETQIQKKLDQTLKRIRKLVYNINNEKSTYMGKNPLARFAGWLQRVGYKYEFPALAKKFGLVPERCTKCGICAKNCPVNNIQMGDNGPKFDDKCILCVRCYNFCPTAAIKFGKKAHPIEKIPLYRGPILGFKPDILHEAQELL